MNNNKKILWLSRHEILSVRETELKRLFGQDIEIIQDHEDFKDVKDIILRIRKIKPIEIVIVAPLSMIHKLVQEGIKPLWAEMMSLPKWANKYDVFYNNRKYKFLGFKRIKDINIKFEEI